MTTPGAILNYRESARLNASTRQGCHSWSAQICATVNRQEPKVIAPGTEARARLNRDKVVGAAIALADKGGLQSLSMRKLGGELGIEAMSLYNHVSSKGDLIDVMIDLPDRVSHRGRPTQPAPPGHRRRPDVKRKELHG